MTAIDLNTNATKLYGYNLFWNPVNLKLVTAPLYKGITLDLYQMIYKPKTLNMKKLLLLTLSLSLFGACNVKKEEKGEMPELDVDVTADAGELPEYDVNWADVDVGTRTDTLEIPKVVIVMEEEEVEVPYIDVDMPNGEEKMEKSIVVEAEVTDTEHNLEIQEIWAADDNLYVISELKSTGQDIGDKKMRVSDQVTLNAPDLNVKHYIIGVRPDRVFNTQYDYLNSKNSLEAKVPAYTVIYRK